MSNRAGLLVLCSVAFGCFEAPSLSGAFLCDARNACPSAGLVCDDGVCCSPGGEPPCPTLVPDGGVCANGDAPRRYFLDADQDGFGDDAHSRWLCAEPVVEPLVSQGGDCLDLPTQAGMQMHPRAPEMCDGLDNNCNRQIDENPEGEGQPCRLSQARGVCIEGMSACRNGTWVCASKVGAGPERCDGLDNDCDGETDEAPSCGGPQNLMAPASGMSFGARVFPSGLQGGTSIARCLKNVLTAQNGYFARPTWSGSGATSHLFWAESATPWDLSAPGEVLELRFVYSMVNASASTPWALHGQPVVYLCDDRGGHARLVHFENGLSMPLMKGPSGTVSTRVPLSGNDEWVLGANLDLDLTRVIRVELLIQPNKNPNGLTPSFSVSLPLDGGFGFRRD